jgi:hypothetical protein
MFAIGTDTPDNRRQVYHDIRLYVFQALPDCIQIPQVVIVLINRNGFPASASFKFFK